MTVQFDNISLQMKNKIPDFQQVELCPVVKWGVLSVQYFIVRSLYLSKVQQPQEQRYPFLSVHAVCSFVQTMKWLPVFGVFNVRHILLQAIGNEGCTHTVIESSLEGEGRGVS